MATFFSRRRFLESTAALGTVAGLGDYSFLGGLPAVSAAETQLAGSRVLLDDSIAPLVRLIEETPRERLLEEVADRIRRGLNYSDLLAALLLAGVTNVEPRPSVGHKFHTVLVVNSAHLASVAGPPEHRWLPIFWSLDYFKAAAARDVQERGDWVMPPVEETAVPAPHKAREAFLAAMENWDEGAADAAVAQLARTGGQNEVYEMFFRLGARDFRSIGHKAIYVANSFRTLQCIGWRHAEPVLRSLTYALLMHEEGNPRDRDAEADRPWRRNQGLAAKFPEDWLAGKLDDDATRELLAALRTGSNDETCDLVVQLLGRGAAPQSLWDALHVRAGEMLMQQPGIVALHAVTTANALQFAFHAAAEDETRRLVLLQCAAFLPMFREAMRSRGRIDGATIDALRESAQRRDPAQRDVGEIFAELGRNRSAAAAQTLSYLAQGGSAGELIDAARLLVFLKSDDAHDYKFSSAVLEDYYHVSPGWRNVYLAANTAMLQNSGARDNALVARARAALQG